MFFQQASAPLETPVRVNWEFADFGTDPESGARIMRLTSSAQMSNMLYCENPFTSPDGKRLVIVRTADQFLGSYLLLVADLETKLLSLIEPSIPSNAKRAQAPWGEWFYYVTHEYGVRRFSLVTLVKEQVLPSGTLTSDGLLHNVTPDGGLLIVQERVVGGPTRFAAYDTATGRRRVILESPHFIDHELLQPVTGDQLLFHEIIGDAVHVYVMQSDGTDRRQVPIGDHWSATSTGHHAWVADSGRIACAVTWHQAEKMHDPRHPDGNLLIAAPGDERPTVFPAAQHGFYHVSISRCGTYFVCDDFMDFAITAGHSGPARIVVGNLHTGKHRTLLADCQSYGIAGCSWYEPCPYFTADNAHVIFNASPFGLNQVFAAEVPSAFLASLD